MNDRIKAGDNGPGSGAGRVRRSSAFPLRSLLRKAADEEGANLVEFALAATVFFMVLFGIMGFCMVAYSYAFVSNAAREATRYAIVRGKSQIITTDCSSVGPANCIAQGGVDAGDIYDYVKSLAPLGINASKLDVDSNWLTKSGGSCGTDDSCKVPGNQVVVQVSYTYDLNVPFVPQHSFAISSSSQMVIAQ